MESSCFFNETSHLFNASAAHLNIFALSNSLGIGLLDTYIALIADDKASELPCICFYFLNM